MARATKLQLTLAVLKPDVIAHPHRTQEIKTAILNNNFYFVRSQVKSLSRKQAEDFYNEHQEKFFYNRLVSYISSGPLSAHILARHDAIKFWRRMMGPTKVYKTAYIEPLTIRGKYGLTDTRNSTHGSDSDESARKEINFYFPEFDIDSWYKNEEIFFRQKMVAFNSELFQHIVDSTGEHLPNNDVDVSSPLDPRKTST